ncbi:MAG: thermonuclease family protein, partial [Rhodospirillaceae bacterium]|nr:thermonuclease family protein [Rhodospirillaceae bacterium]
ELYDGLGGFQLIEGIVLKTALVRGRVYLNFGQDWRQDFTITVAPRDRRLFDRAGFDHQGLAGHRVRVRGWLKHYNGPSIEASHPEQIEILD